LILTSDCKKTTKQLWLCPVNYLANMILKFTLIIDSPLQHICIQLNYVVNSWQLPTSMLSGINTNAMPKVIIKIHTAKYLMWLTCSKWVMLARICWKLRLIRVIWCHIPYDYAWLPRGIPDEFHLILIRDLGWAVWYNRKEFYRGCIQSEDHDFLLVGQVNLFLRDFNFPVPQ